MAIDTETSRKTGHAKHDLVNIGTLDTAYNILQSLQLSLNRAGIGDLADKTSNLMEEVFRAKMQLRRELDL